MTDSRPRRAMAPDEAAPSRSRGEPRGSVSGEEDTVIFRRAIFGDDLGPEDAHAPMYAQPPAASRAIGPEPGAPYQPPARMVPPGPEAPGPAGGRYEPPAAAQSPQTFQLRAPRRLGAPVPAEPDWWREAMGMAPAPQPQPPSQPGPLAPQPAVPTQPAQFAPQPAVPSQPASLPPQSVAPPYYAQPPLSAPEPPPYGYAPLPVAPPGPAAPGPAPAVPARPASGGRRFSLDDLIQETTDTAMQTLGAEAPAAPDPGFPEPEITPPVEVVAPPRDAVTLPEDVSYTGVPRRGAPPAPSRRRHPGRAIIVIAAVVVVAILVGLAVWMLQPRTAEQPGIAVPPPSAPDPLLTAADLTPINLGSNWVTSQTAPSPADVVCVGQDATKTGSPRLITRQLVSGDQATDVVTQFAATFADDVAASAAYQAALGASGTCASGGAQIVSAFSVTGLTDDASGITALVQGQTPTNHTILLARTGRTLIVVDTATAGDAVPASSVANATANALNRLCQAGQGTCPSADVVVAQAIPAPDDPPGWLIPADMPLITPTAGRWGALDRSAITSISSQCDGVALNAVPGTTSARQRTLMLAGDPNMPADFGVDEVVFTFAKAANAKALSTSLTTNISGCSTSVPTATVVTGDQVKGAGENKTQITASTYRITHKVSATQTTIFRVSVILVGTHVGYVLANPTADYDFTDAQWQALTLRAGERISQGA